MPSIASVSQLTIETATDKEPHGTILIAKGGDVLSQEPISRPVGTKISVENLFFNTPARLKYMRSQQAELSHIVDIVNRLSLAHPEIAFTLVSDGNDMTKTTGSGDLRQAVAGIYGLANAKKMLEIQGSGLDFEFSGYISLPELTRANRNYLTLLINGRYIKNFLLNRAIIEGYGSKLMVGRFPIAVIDIQIDPYLADVNVHPTKQEVRLSNEQELMKSLTESISQALKTENLIPDALENLNKGKTRLKDKAHQTHLPLKDSKLYYDVKRQDFFLKPSSTVSEKPLETDIGEEKTSQIDNSVKEVDKEKAIRFAQRQLEENQDIDHPDFSKSALEKVLLQLDKEEKSTFPELEYFGQMHGTYLFAQGQSGLYIIDQHAAQERIKYEYYRQVIGDVDSSQQQLLVPYLFEFPTNDMILLKERMDHLREVGIYLEEYGEQQLILREHPIWLDEAEIESGIYEMCDMLLLTNAVSIKKYRAKLAIMMSCKRSIKANHSLDDYSARELLKELATCDNPYNCPHGRPVLVNLSKSDMEKMFRRIQENHQSLKDLGKY